MVSAGSIPTPKNHELIEFVFFFGPGNRDMDSIISFEELFLIKLIMTHDSH